MACGDRSQITSYNPSMYVAYFDNGAYWYYTGNSFGFSPESSIELSSSEHYGDTDSSSCEQRLSWITTGEYGGYRAGCDTELYDNTDDYWSDPAGTWYKVRLDG